MLVTKDDGDNSYCLMLFTARVLFRVTIQDYLEAAIIHSCRM